jgi:hypothetical protein
MSQGISSIFFSRLFNTAKGRPIADMSGEVRYALALTHASICAPRNGIARHLHGRNLETDANCLTLRGWLTGCGFALHEIEVRKETSMKKQFLAIAALLAFSAGSALSFDPPRHRNAGQSGQKSGQGFGQQAGQRKGKKMGPQDGGTDSSAGYWWWQRRWTARWPRVT